MKPLMDSSTTSINLNFIGDCDCGGGGDGICIIHSRGEKGFKDTNQKVSSDGSLVGTCNCHVQDLAHLCRRQSPSQQSSLLHGDHIGLECREGMNRRTHD